MPELHATGCRIQLMGHFPAIVGTCVCIHTHTRISILPFFSSGNAFAESSEVPCELSYIGTAQSVFTSFTCPSHLPLIRSDMLPFYTISVCFSLFSLLISEYLMEFNVAVFMPL